MFMKHICLYSLVALIIFSCAEPTGKGQVLGHSSDEEGYYYQLISLPIPQDIELEVGGLDAYDDGSLAIATRRGEVWRIDDVYGQDPEPSFQLFAQGLHEPLGLLVKDNAIYTAQRGELTRLLDEDNDGRADVYETVYAWPLTGNYHEYSYGPLELPNGNLFVSLNLAWVGYGASPAKWRGWALEITPQGEMTPMAVGFRSPAGIGITSAGDVFYGENQGDWIGSGWISHVETGDFLGHPGGLRWTGEDESPLSLTYEDIPNTGEPMFAAARDVPELKLPAVWFPHTVMGISTSAIIEDNTAGGFGPFTGQLFVGDQGHSKLMRVYLEKVDGRFQGANFPFYEGFSSGILRTTWGHDHSLFVGQTSRGWDATGKSPFALERLVWTGNVPFEMKEIQALPDGFRIVFTMPVNLEQGANPSMYDITSFTYKYHNTYGSPAINVHEHVVSGVDISSDGMSVDITLEDMREGYIHEIRLGDMVSSTGLSLLHDYAFYTLNAIPKGESTETLRDDASMAESTPDNGLSKRPLNMPAEWNESVDQRIELGTMPGLQFDVDYVEVKAGSKVALTFINDDDMLHNLVITSPETVEAVSEASMNLGIRGESLFYVPEMEEVMYHSGLLQPGSKETLFFNAPDVPGDYPFVCTFPGHAMTMRGIIRVQ